MRWFVHVSEPYYPSAHVVEAKGVKQAIEKAWKLAGHSGPDYDEDRVSFVVTPLGSAVFAGPDEEVKKFFPDGRFKGVQRAVVPSSILGDPVVRQQKADEWEKFRIARATYAIYPIGGVASVGTL